jgi:predicted dehydrogenase
MKPLRFAILGTGFRARYQLAAWREVKGATCVALYSRTRARAAALGEEFGIDAIDDDPGELLRRERPAFVDIITDVTAHAAAGAEAGHGSGFTRAGCHGLLADDCHPMPRRQLHQGRVPFFVHENFRWQSPIRALAGELKRGAIGRPFRARIDFISGFPVFENQPFLAELEQFILTDLGSHLLDVARFLFGEAKSLCCCTRRIHKRIKGEDVVTVLLEMGNGMLVTVNLAYAGHALEREAFPETLIAVEGERGRAELVPGCELRVTTRAGTRSHAVPPPCYDSADPRYAVVPSSIVRCHENRLRALQGRGNAESTAADNLRTVRLVFAAYQSAATGRTIILKH